MQMSGIVTEILTSFLYFIQFLYNLFGPFGS